MGTAQKGPWGPAGSPREPLGASSETRQCFMFGYICASVRQELPRGEPMAGTLAELASQGLP